jgi:serpin B
MRTTLRQLPLTTFTLAATLTAGACGNDDGPPSAPAVDVARSTKLRATPAVSDPDRKALADGNAAFALDFYGQLKKKNAGQNVVFSPVSISTALSMTYAGAKGQTESETASALRWDLPQPRHHAAMNELDAALAARGEGKLGTDGKPFRLNVVNTTWMQKDETFLPAYLDVLAEHYGAGVNLLDFITNAEGSRKTINAWVEAKTEDRIKELIPMGVINAATRLVLTNAVYFNAAWRTPFSATVASAPFKRLDGSSVNVPMMRQPETGFPAATGAGWTAVALPYQDERLSMLLVVPDEGKFDTVEASLNAVTLAQMVAGLAPRTVTLQMPRFKFETAASLKELLQALGMNRAFEPGVADFSGMDGTMSLYIQAVLHKAFIAVGEKGTEAAAATAVVVGRTSAPLDVLFLTADRPFLFFLRDEPTGAILFLGRVLDPSQTSGG